MSNLIEWFETHMQNNAPNIKLRILSKRGYDGLRYNLPTKLFGAVFVKTFSAVVSKIEPTYVSGAYGIVLCNGESSCSLCTWSQELYIQFCQVFLRGWCTIRFSGINYFENHRPYQTNITVHLWYSNQLVFLYFLHCRC